MTPMVSYFLTETDTLCTVHSLLTPVSWHVGLHGWCHIRDRHQVTTTTLQNSCSLVLGSRDHTNASRHTHAENEDTARLAHERVLIKLHNTNNKFSSFLIGMDKRWLVHFLVEIAICHRYIFHWHRVRSNNSQVIL